MIRATEDVPGGFALQVDVVVVGSGAGGGVAAAVFAEAGRSVLVLEEGPHVPAEQMTQREEQMYPLLYRDGGQQFTNDGGVNVLQGRVLGGSTVVNMADITDIPGAVLDHWAHAFGVDRFDAAAVEAAAQVVRAELGANTIPMEQVNQNGQVLLRGGAARGLSGGSFEHNRVGCVGSGFCLVGCAYEAKRSVALTWIPRAIKTGHCTVQCGARVERLDHANGVVSSVSGTLAPVEPGAPRAAFRVICDHVVMAAGAIHSPLILERSGLGGPRIGRNLSLQPQAPVAALFPDPVVHWRGIPQAAYIDSTETISREEGLGGFRLEAVSGTPGMALSSVPLWGAAAADFVGRYRHVAALLALVPDRPAGRVRPGSGHRPEVRYDLRSAWAGTLRTAVRTAAEVYFAAGADTVVLPFSAHPIVRPGDDLGFLDRIPVEPSALSLISAHPQGTCRMGHEPKRSVVDGELFVHGVANLQVLDASIFPTSASSHTMLPIMSFAWLGAHAALDRP